jgi:hypothetical protein
MNNYSTHNGFWTCNLQSIVLTHEFELWLLVVENKFVVWPS